MVNIGTLFAFVLVSIGVIVLRRTRPDLPRAFRTPAVPLIPILAVIACVFLMLNLGTLTWWRVPGLDGPGVRRLLPLRLPAQPPGPRGPETSGGEALGGQSSELTGVAGM